MMYPIDDETDVYETVVAYLERQGVEGLRQPHDASQINKSAVLRWLLLATYQEALDNPPAPAGQIHRQGPARPRRKSVLPSDPSGKRRA